MIRCAQCDREEVADGEVFLDELGEILCPSCNDRLSHELDMQYEEELYDSSEEDRSV